MNPFIPRDQIFVDGYDFTAYEEVGFGNFVVGDTDAVKDVKIGVPDFGMGTWWKYLTSMSKLSPIPPDGMKFGELPEGVLRLGGTFVVKNDDVVYQWNDRLPGDHPNTKDVIAIAKEAAKKKESFSMDGFFKNMFA